jgi:hypothetical protein
MPNNRNKRKQQKTTTVIYNEIQCHNNFNSVVRWFEGELLQLLSIGTLAELTNDVYQCSLKCVNLSFFFNWFQDNPGLPKFNFIGYKHQA